MSATIAIRFPLGRYHATPWDRSVNEGAVEWPPAPWRLLRTLVAIWHTRWPDLPAATLDSLLDTLGDPPSYRTPPIRPGHSRHYLPDLDHKSGQTGATDLALDPYLMVSRDAELLVRWEADLTGEQREALAKLVELVPYLGRAESVCEARLLDSDPVPDESWWRPGGSGGATRLLAAVRPVRRPSLELSTVEVRKGGRTVPPETRWVGYVRAGSDEPAEASVPLRPAPVVNALRFAVMYRAPVRNSYGVLLADELHRLVVRALDGGRAELLGHNGAGTDHRHAHWIPLAESDAPGAPVESVLIWARAGWSQDEIGKVLGARLRGISGWRGARNGRGYEVKGLPEVHLLLQAAGDIATVAPELCGPSRRWRSRTPYLPVRHRKRESLDAYLAKDVQTELGYRGMGQEPVVVRRAEPDQGLPDLWARRFRRYRMDENLGNARRGLGLQLEFDREITGPLLLGQLSHFGYGLLVPDRG